MRALGAERAEIAESNDRYTSMESGLLVPPRVVRGLLHSGRFEELEELFSAFDAYEVRIDPLTTPSQVLYGAFGIRDGDVFFNHEIELWRRHSPESKYPKLALASMRSQQFFRKATSWRSMEERQALGMDSRLALQAIREAEKDSACRESAELWEAKMIAATASGVPSEVCESAFLECIKRDPRRWSAYGWRLNRETPQWTGRDMGPFYKQLDRLSKDYGPEVYTACAIWYFREFYAHREGQFKRIGFKWKRLEEGFEALDKLYPDNLFLQSMRARFALLYGQNDVAREVLDELEGDISWTAFGTAEAWKQASQVLGAPAAPSDKVVSYPAGPESRFLESFPVLHEEKVGKEVEFLALSERFYALEALAESLSQKEILLDKFYVSSREAGLSDNVDSIIARFERWGRLIPESQAARTALANYLVVLAYEARGTGWADSVTEEGWKVFRQRLNEAAPLLETPSDSFGCTTRIEIAMGRSEPVDVVNEMVKLSSELDPKAVGPVIAKCAYLLPRWGGSREELIAFMEQVMQERGDSVLLPILNSSNYGDVFKEFVSEDMRTRATQAAVKVPVDPKMALQAAKFNAYSSSDPEKFRVFLAEVKEQKADLRWAPGDYQAYLDCLDRKNTAIGSAGKVVEWGEYRSTLPEPERVDGKSSFPVVEGRSIGLRVRYSHNVANFIERRVKLERPGPDGPIVEERVQWLAPLTLLDGEEELILWDILDKNSLPGTWTLTVTDNWEELAKQEFQMVDGKGASEPGLRLVHSGPMVWDKEFLVGYPVAGTTKAEIGRAFGAEGIYVGKPRTASKWYSMPGKPRAEEYDIDCSRVPKGYNPETHSDFILERPDELRPGLWKLGYKINGRDVGEIPIQVDKP